MPAKAPKAPRKLKVFRTATGFRDAYVAAPSRAAALRAWGAEKDLFARGAAEEVTDPALMAEALARPGEVFTRSRGGLREQVAALDAMPKPAARPKAKGAKQDIDDTLPRKSAAETPPRRARQRPSRDDLDAIEAALEQLKTDRNDAETDLRARERALAEEKRASHQDFSRRLERLQAKADKARATYADALRAWKG